MCTAHENGGESNWPPSLTAPLSVRSGSLAKGGSPHVQIRGHCQELAHKLTHASPLHHRLCESCRGSTWTQGRWGPPCAGLGMGHGVAGTPQR